MASTSTAEPPSSPKECPNWLEMPHELMENIFQRLPTVEILNNARKVCTTWLKICQNPAMWKVIKMVKPPPASGWGWDTTLELLTKEAVDLSCGELIDISIAGFGTDNLLDHIVLRSTKLKRLCLVKCVGFTALNWVFKRVPKLEELHLFKTPIYAQEIEVIGRNCPQLKSFKMNQVFSSGYGNHALAIANNMPELRHLDLCGIDMTNDGLEAILNGCPHLQSLDVRMCYGLHLDGNLGKMCMERIKDFKHGYKENCGFIFHFSESDSDEDYEHWIL